MFDKLKKMVEVTVTEATPEEKQLAKGALIGGGVVLGMWLLSTIFPHVPDPANRQPGDGK